MEWQRRVVCAANKDDGGRLHLGIRHMDALMRESFRIAYCEFLPQSEINKTASNSVQGFIDNQGKFMTRLEAWTVAEAAGQIINRVGGDGPDRTGLFSENIY